LRPFVVESKVRTVAAKKTARRRAADREPEHHGFTVVLEEMRGQFRVFGEALQGLREHMDARFAQVETRFERVDARFERVDARFERVDADLGLLKSAVIDQGRRMGRIEGDLRDVHIRLDRIEGRLTDES
jgi:hypothetical protein